MKFPAKDSHECMMSLGSRRGTIVEQVTRFLTIDMVDVLKTVDSLRGLALINGRRPRNNAVTK